MNKMRLTFIIDLLCFMFAKRGRRLALNLNRLAYRG